MKKLIKINKETLYLVGYFLMGLSAVVIGNSYLFGVNRFQICEVVQYLSATIFLWSFCIDKYKIFDFVSAFLFGVVILISAIIMHDITFALYGISIVTSLHIDVRKIVKSSVINNAIFLCIVIIPALLGFIPDDIYYHENMKAHCLGFAYYSNVPCVILMETFAIYWLIRSKKMERLFLILSLPVHILVYKVCTVRLEFYVYIIFMLAVLILGSINVNKQHKFMTCIATFMYPLAAVSVILASLKYKSSAIIFAFNEMINSRLKFNLQGFEQYGVNLIGQRIKSNQEYIDQNFVNHYFYIDCGYVYMLIGYGLILFAIIMFLYTYLSHYAMKTNNIKLISWCFAICVFSVINNIMFNTALNPLLILGIKLLLSNKITDEKREGMPNRVVTKQRRIKIKL